MTLDEIYKAALDDEVFFVEYDKMPAAAGDLRDLTYLAETAARKDGSLEPVTPDEFLDGIVTGFMGAVIDLCVLGDVTGEDRVANCQSAWDKFKEKRAKGYFPRVAKVRADLGLPVHSTKNLGTF
jgi:hypothetical protein